MRSAPTFLLLHPLSPFFSSNFGGRIRRFPFRPPLLRWREGEIGRSIGLRPTHIGGRVADEAKGKLLLRLFVCNSTCFFVECPRERAICAPGRGQWRCKFGKRSQKLRDAPPMQDWKRELNGGTMKDFILKTDDRRGNLPLCFA